MSQTRRSRFVREQKQRRRRSEGLRSTRRWSSVERLEDRQLLNADYNPWHNYSIREDVNGDSYVTAYDALLLINELNVGGSRRLGDLLASNMALDGQAEGESPSASAAKLDVTGDFYLTPVDALTVINHLNAEGEGPNGELARVRARVAQDLAPPAKPGFAAAVNRADVTSLAPGATLRVETFLKDLRNDDGDNNPSTDERGVYAAYYDLLYDSKAFKVLETPQNNLTGKPVLPFAASFQDPLKFQPPAPFPTLPETFYYDYPNGPKGNLVATAVNDLGSFSGATAAMGPNEVFHLDVRFQARAVWAENDTGSVNEGATTTINVLANDELISGQKFFTPARPSTTAGAVSGTDFLVFGNTGFGTGSDGKGSIVPWTATQNLVQSIQDDVLINAVTGAVKTLIDVGTDDPFDTAKGTASIVNGQVQYVAKPGVGPTTDVFSYRISNGVNTALYEVGNVTVTINAVNDPPVNTVPQGVQTINEDNPLDFVAAKTISVSDADAGAGTLQVQVVATNGTFTLGNPAQVSFTFSDADGTGTGDGMGDATMRFRGTLTQLNAALAASYYLPAANFYGAATVTITTNDLRNTGSVAQIDTDTISITVQPVNDVPENRIGGQADFSTKNQTVTTDNLPLVFSAANGNGLSVEDVDAPFASGGDIDISVTFDVAAGTLTLTNSGSLSVTGNNSSNVQVQGKRIAINTALASGLQYTGPVGQHTFTMITSDLGNVGGPPVLTDTDQLTITVVPPTRPFAVTDTFTVDEDSGTTELNVLLNDFNFASQQGGAGLNIKGITQPPAGQGTVAITSGGTRLSYTTANDFATPPVVVFTYTIEDTTGGVGAVESTASVSVTVAAQNDAPVLTIVQPAGPIDEDQTVPIDPAAITIADVDAGSGLMKATIVVANGTVTITNKTGLTFLTGDGTADANLVFTGTLAALSNAADNATFTPAENFFGTATVAITIDDQGNTGAGGAKQDSETLTIQINPVNDPPAVSAPTAAVTDEDVALNFANGSAVSVVDVEGDDATVSLAATHGSLTVATGSGATFTDADGSDGTLAFEGTLAQVNAALAGLQFTPAPFFNTPAGGTAALSIDVDDAGPGKNAPRTVTITVREVNNAPTAVGEDLRTGANAVAAREDTPVTIAGSVLTANDSPGPANESTQTLKVVAGSSPNGQVQINAANNVVFTPAANFNGLATITYTIEDNGTTAGVADFQQATANVTITVAAVNDAPENRINGSPNFLANPQATDDNTPLPFNAANQNLLTIQDVEADAATYTVNLSLAVVDPPGAASAGTLAVNGGAGAATLQLTGTRAAINAQLATLVYAPPTNFIGTVRMTMATDDGGNAGDEGLKLDTDLVTITVAPFNDPPVAKDDLVQVAEGGQVDFNVFADNGNGIDTAGPNEGFQDIDVVSFNTTGTQGTVTLLDGETGAFRYVAPNSDFFGQTTFKYTIRDNGQSRINGQIVDDFKEATGTVTITVTEVNDSPVAGDDLLLIDPQPAVGQTFVFPVSQILGNDTPGPANESGQQLRVVSLGPTTLGATVQLTNNGTQIEYTVPAGFEHVDEFEYTIEDDGTTDGAADPQQATGKIIVRDVVLSDITGYAYLDGDGDGQRDPGERGLAGVRMRLTGTDITGAAVEEETYTDANGYWGFMNLLPNQQGTRYTVTQVVQPTGLLDGPETGGANATPMGSDSVEVDLPITGIGNNPDTSASSENNFAERGFSSSFASIGAGALLHSQSGEGGLLDLGLLFATDADGNLLWHVNVGGWQDYTPGRETPDGSGQYQVTVVNGQFWVTDLSDDSEHVVQVPAGEGRLRQTSSNGTTITHIIGDSGYFGLAAAMGEGESPLAAEAAEVLAAGAEVPYADAVDAVFAEAALA